MKYYLLGKLLDRNLKNENQPGKVPAMSFTECCERILTFLNNPENK